MNPHASLTTLPGPALLGLCLLLGGCATRPWTPPDSPAPAAFHTQAAAEAEVPADDAWWLAFDDPALDALIEQAAFGNLDLAAAEQRIRQAQFGLAAAEGARLPGLDASASTSRSERDDRWRAQAALRASYTLDLWGAERARVDAALARLDAVTETRHLNAWRLATAVVQLHVSRRALDERLLLAEDSLRLAESTFARMQARYDAGLISGLDLALAENAVLGERAARLAIDQARQQAVNAAATLLGRPPGEVGGVASDGRSLLDVTVPALPEAVPSAVLLRRPDIRIAEAGLRAAHADIEVARGQLLPQVSLSAGSAISRGGGGWIADISAGLAQRIFDGGQRRAGIRQAEAGYEELLIGYRGSILAAIVEVEDALLLAEHLARREALEREQLAGSERAFRLSEARYRSGLIDALTLLSSQNAYLRARDGLLQTRAARLQALAGLYAAVVGHTGISR